MTNYFQNVRFKYNFRDYQKEFLKNIENYINDNKIHIVAAPGAGKTILGLELCRIINKKALIIVPSIALKEQWKERFIKDFENTKSMVSSSFDDDKVITIITYQMLHSMVKKGDDVAKLIQNKNIETIVLDECHHMRRIWFVSLKNVVSQLKKCKIISLTATPPYDNTSEFKNYMELCGDIDERITAGQLVKSGCLCPHQDFIYVNLPSKEQNLLMKSIQKFSDGLMKEVQNSEQFITAVALNDMITSPNKDDVIKDFDFYVALCSFLHSVKVNYNSKELGIDFTPPTFDKNMLALLLERYIYGKISEAKIISPYLEDVKRRLEIEGCIKEKHINLIYSNKLSKQILANSGKLNSICEIAELEYTNQKDNLSLAICTDFIKDEYYEVENEEDIDELGVLPIFRKLRTQCPYINTAVLTGSLIYIPTFLTDKIQEIALNEYNIKNDEIKIKELGIDFDYSSVEFAENKKKYAVNIITKLFSTKNIQVLIGTIALIGEGWDAPFVNSLIIASSVSTYVSSNQIRGRAIRVDSSDPDKVSNIWHLVTMESYNTGYILGKDYRSIINRFAGVEGINSKQNTVEMGYERLNIEQKIYTKEEVAKLNQNTIKLSENRKQTRDVWTKALKRYVPEYYERLSEAEVQRTHSAKLKFLNKRRVKRLTKGLLIAMKRARILSPNASFIVKYRSNSYDVLLLGANTHDQIIFANAVKQQYEVDFKTRYIVMFRNKIYPVPEILGRKKELAEIYRKSLGLPLSKLIYIKSEEGKKILLENKLNFQKGGPPEMAR